MKFKGVLIGLVASLTIGGISVGLADTIGGNPYYKRSQDDTKYTEITGGVIRLDKSEVYLHTNATHISVGIERVYIEKSSGALIIEKDYGNPVVSTMVTVDEELASKGVTVGLSGGGRVSKVYFFQHGKRLNLAKRGDYNKISSSTSNIWFSTINYDVDKWNDSRNGGWDGGKGKKRNN